jgi:hypothetical protein
VLELSQNGFSLPTYPLTNLSKENYENKYVLELSQNGFSLPR